MNNKAQFSIFNIFTFMIVAFMAVVLFAGLIYVTGILNNTFHDIGVKNDVNAGKPGYVNMTQAADNTFGQMNNSIQALRLVALTLIFSLILGIFVSNALIRISPAFFFVYVLIVTLAVVFSVPISNAYHNLLGTNVYDGLLQTFTGANWLLLHLPLVTTIVGLLGGIFLFINLVRVGNEGIIQ